MKWRRGKPARGLQARSGSSLVEILVAVIILGVAASGIAGMAFQAGRSSTVAAETARRDAVLRSATDLVSSTSYDGLLALAGCADGGDDGFAYLLCIGVSQEGENLREVTVQVDPDGESISVATAVLLRSRTPPPTPF